jgi:phosphoglycerate dehydrogenase-like enzyme
MRIAILDDVERVALSSADWSSLGADDVVALDRHVGDHDELVALLEPYDVVVVQRERTPFPRALLERLPNLRLLLTTGFRNASLDVAACTELGITVCNTGGDRSPVVEMTWALILAALRDVPHHAQAMRAGQWEQIAGRSLEGSTLGLVGLGKTGTRMGEIARAFRMDVVAWSANLTAETAEERGARLVGKRELFEVSDVVSIHLLLSGRTRGLVGAEELRAMKPDAWLVNTSRGPIVDETALLRALREKWIAGAALDVFETEPLPADHELRTLPTTVLTPHAGYVTRENYRDWYSTAVDVIAAYAAGTPIRVVTAT